MIVNSKYNAFQDTVFVPSIATGDIQGSVGLGESNRCMRLQPDDVTYDAPVKKLNKFKKRLTGAEDVAFLPGDRVVVCDKDGGTVNIYDENGKFFRYLTKDVRPFGVTTTQAGMVAVIDSRKKDKFIKIFSSDNGDLFSKFGEDQNWKPHGLTFSNKGQLIITDVSKKKHSVGIYTLDGRQLHTFGALGSMAHNFRNPYYVAVDMFDRILVSDHDNHAIKVFDYKGKYLGRIGSQGTAPGELMFPRGICTDARGNIIVCDTGNKRVCVFSVDGRYIQDLLTSKDDALGYPYGIAYSKETKKLAVTQHTSVKGAHIRKVRVYELGPLPPLHLERETF